jgi:hypothetical protein
VDEEATVSTRDLLRRGWSKRLIARYLDAPDKALRNPYIASGAEKRLYLLARVEKIECQPTFIAARERSAKYSKRLKETAKSSREAMLAYVESLVLPRLTLRFSEIMEQARERKKRHPDLLQRAETQVALDILLGILKPLDWHLDSFAWHAGVRDARIRLRQRMLAHIATTYPRLDSAAKIRISQLDGNADTW